MEKFECGEIWWIIGIRWFGIAMIESGVLNGSSKKRFDYRVIISITWESGGVEAICIRDDGYFEKGMEEIEAGFCGGCGACGGVFWVFDTGTVDRHEICSHRFR